MDKFTTDRDDAIRWARKLFEHGEFVILDTETTGLDSAAEIMQFAFCNHDASNEIQFDVKPTERASLDEGAFRVHGITLESVATAPPITIWADTIVAIIKGKTVIGWNASFDYRMLIQSFNAWGVEPPAIIHLANFECAMIQYSKFVGDWDARRGQYRWQKLPGATHGSLADCRATLNVLREMAAARLSTDDTLIKVNTTIDYNTETITQELAFAPEPETTSTTVEVDEDGDLFEGSANYRLEQLLNIAGVFVPLDNIQQWTAAQRVEVATWAAGVAVANISELLGQPYTIPPRPAFFPAEPEIDIPF